MRPLLLAVFLALSLGAVAWALPAGQESETPPDPGAGAPPEPQPQAAPAPAGTPPEPPADPTPRRPRTPRQYAAVLAAEQPVLDAAIDRWLAAGGRGETPQDVRRAANRRQYVIRRLGTGSTGLRRTLRLLPAGHRAAVRDEVMALRELRSIHSVVVQRPKIRIGPPHDARDLRRHYRRAWRRFGVGWPLLAAVNFVETRFGRLRNESVSGARGPMQFMPATWRAYGMGGDVHDPRDAIMGAANYLHASGAPGNERRALYAYNPSWAYVSAVSRIARRMRADERAFRALHAWNVRHLRR